jgi:YD repeat-containing protein
MRTLRFPLAAVFLLAAALLFANAGRSFAEEDFSRPKYHLGWTDYAGRMQLWRDMAFVVAEPDLVLPWRLRFTAAPGVGRPTFGRFWECALLESTLVLEGEGNLVWKTLGGRTSYLGRKKDGTFAGGDGRISARQPSPAEWLVATEGAEYRYVDGKIKSLRLSSGSSVEWIYQGSRILGIARPNGEFLLTVEYSGSQALPYAIVVQKKRFALKYQKVPVMTALAGAPVVAGFEESLQEYEGNVARESFPVKVEPSGDYVMEFSTNSEKPILFVWDSVSGRLKSDGYWIYATDLDAAKGTKVTRTDHAGRQESYFYDTKTGISEHRKPDGETVTRSYFIAAGPTQYKIRKATSVKDGKEIASSQWSYDDMGRLVRERSGEYEKSWTWSAEGKLLGESETYGEKVLDSVQYDPQGRPVERTVKGRTYRYAYEEGKKIVQRVQDGKVLSSRVIDARTGQVAFFKPDEKSGSLQGVAGGVWNAVPAKEFEHARALAERSLQILLNEKTE